MEETNIRASGKMLNKDETKLADRLAKTDSQLYKIKSPIQLPIKYALPARKLFVNAIDLTRDISAGFEGKTRNSSGDIPHSEKKTSKAKDGEYNGSETNVLGSDDEYIADDDYILKDSYKSWSPLRKYKSPLADLGLGDDVKKVGASSQWLLRKSVHPIKTAGKVVVKPLPKPKGKLIDGNKSIDGISKSFAGYLATASMYAGFQDIENESREMETNTTEPDGSSIRNSEASPSVQGGNSEDGCSQHQLLDHVASKINEVVTLKDNDSNIDQLESIVSDDGSSVCYSKSDSTIPIPTFKDETIREKEPVKPRRNLSVFELSVVKRVTDGAGTDGDADFLVKRAEAITEKLKNVFGINDNEEFLGDYPCWLMGDVLLQGHLYTTTYNILFFAFLPKKRKDAEIKSGALSVASFHSLRLHRKWVIIRGNTFSIYSSPTELYFPELVIDLRTALRAEVYGNSKTGDPLTPVWIRIVTENRTHWFQAENHDVARSWVTTLKKQIFSSRNKGDQVAIKIPLQNLVDIELTSIVGVAKNLRIKVIENNESFAIDDYYLMFFSDGERAIRDIKQAVENAGVQVCTDIDQETLDYSDLIKSKMELLKHSASAVESTNFKPKKRNGILKGIKSALLSSDEESEVDTDTDYVDDDDANDDDDDNNNNNEASILEPDSSDNITKVEGLGKLSRRFIPSRFQSRAKSNDTKASIHPLQDERMNNDSKLAEWGDDDEVTERKWSLKSMVQNVTSFGHGLIFAGPPTHYLESELALEGGDTYFLNNKKSRDQAQKRFIKRFSLSGTEKLVSTYHLYLMKGLPSYGKLYIGTQNVCFRSTVVGSNTVMILPFTDIENIHKESGFRFGYCGLVIVIRGHEELFFEFSANEYRDDCELQLLKQLDIFKNYSSGTGSPDCNFESENSCISSAKLKMFENKLNEGMGVSVPIIIEDHPIDKLQLKPMKVYRFTLLTIGSRGDVQPYIALGKSLLKEGHKVKIVTHEEFKDWILNHGIEFGAIAGDPSELMALMVSNPSINYSFIKEARSKFRAWIDDLLLSSWNACQDADVLIESPSSISGIHIAEKLQIPYFRAFTMPWTRTRAYPHAFLVPDQKLGGSYNYMTHVAFENGYWRGTSYQVNKWRVKTLGLPKTNLNAMHQNSVPFLYNISPVVFPPSVDFSEWVKVTGYWFLDEKTDYTPPEALIAFIKKARDDNKKLVYIGFGSIVVEDPTELTRAVVEAVLASDVRCILNKGWSERLGSKNSKEIEMELPCEIYNSGNIPHDWLFTQIDAAVHHGGSGTTGASLRFGLPTIVKPFFGDQKFYAGRVEDLGCGVSLKSLDSKALSKAIREVTTNSRIIDRAKAVGELIRSENGVKTAIDDIYVLMEYAKRLSIAKHKHGDDVDDEREDENVEMDGSWLLV